MEGKRRIVKKLESFGKFGKKRKNFVAEVEKKKKEVLNKKKSQSPCLVKNR
jgi:hypothetical protein